MAFSPQPVAAQADQIAEEWRWATYAAPTALPAVRVSSVLEDEAGTAWVVGRGTVAWFDDYGWISVGPAEGLPDIEPERLAARAGGGVLVKGSNRLFQGDPGGFDEIVLDLEPGEELYHIASVSRTEILMHSSQGLLRWTAGTLERDIATPGLVGRLATLSRTRDGRVLLFTESGAHEWQSGSWTPRLDFELPPHAWAVQSSGSDLLIMEDSGARQGFWTIASDGSAAFTDVPLPTPLSGFDVALNGDVFIVSAFGRGAVHRNDEWRLVSPTPSGLQGARQVAYSRSGSLWVATAEAVSLVRLGSDRWTRWPEDPTLAESLTVNRILVRPLQNETWMGTADGLVIRQADGALRSVPSINGMRLGVVTGLAQDRNGAVWITSGSGADGAFRYQDGEWQHFDAADGLSVPNYHSVVMDGAGTLWFLGLANAQATANGTTGAVSFDGERFEAWGPTEGLSSNRIYDFAQSPTGALWFGTIDGLSRWENDQWTHFALAEGLRASKVFAVHADADGSIWFGHQNDAAGLGRITGDEVSYLGVDEGLPAVGIWDIAGANDGTLWITARAGLGRVVDGTVAYFGRANGMLASTIWPVLPLADRVLVGAIGGGLLELSLSELSNPSPQVRIGSIDARPGRADIALQVLPYRGEQSPSAAPSRYRVNDEPWSAWSTGRSNLSLALPAGVHEVSIGTRNLFGQPGADQSVTFSVPSPFLRSPLALFGLGAWFASMAVALGAYVRRRRVHLRQIADRERYFRSLIENASDVILVLGPDRGIQYASHSLQTVLGYEPQNVIGRPLHDLLEPSEVEALDRAMTATEDLDSAPAEAVVNFRHATEPQSRALALAVRSERHADGKTVTVIHGRDRSEQDRTEAQLRQALKMEAVGQLTGGVAHDFNNLLTVIIGEMELASEEGGEDLSLAREAASKAAELTSRLLAFSRQQPLMPKAVDLCELVEGLTTLIRRTLSETVQLEVDVAGGPHVVEVDSGQFENAIINLAVNARDAMPTGGQLKLSVVSVQVTATDLELATTVVPGRYIRTTVSDTGWGISPSLLQQVFDPFFTTKEVGAGSGLGLSMVYGFVKQSNGYITIDSKEGVGTAVHVYLPAR